MPFSRLSRKRYKVVNKVKRWRRRRDRTPKLIRLMKTVAMDIRLYVATKRNIVNQFKRIGVKMLFTNSWKECLKRLNTAKVLLKKMFNNIQPRPKSTTTALKNHANSNGNRRILSPWRCYPLWKTIIILPHLALDMGVDQMIRKIHRLEYLNIVRCSVPRFKFFLEIFLNNI